MKRTNRQHRLEELRLREAEGTSNRNKSMQSF